MWNKVVRPSFYIALALTSVSLHAHQEDGVRGPNPACGIILGQQTNATYRTAPKEIVLEYPLPADQVRQIQIAAAEFVLKEDLGTLVEITGENGVRFTQPIKNMLQAIASGEKKTITDKEYYANKKLMDLMIHNSLALKRTYSPPVEQSTMSKIWGTVSRKPKPVENASMAEMKQKLVQAAEQSKDRQGKTNAVVAAISKLPPITHLEYLQLVSELDGAFPKLGAVDTMSVSNVLAQKIFTKSSFYSFAEIEPFLNLLGVNSLSNFLVEYLPEASFTDIFRTNENNTLAFDTALTQIAKKQEGQVKVRDDKEPAQGTAQEHAHLASLFSTVEQACTLAMLLPNLATRLLFFDAVLENPKLKNEMGQVPSPRTLAAIYKALTGKQDAEPNSLISNLAQIYRVAPSFGLKILETYSFLDRARTDAEGSNFNFLLHVINDTKGLQTLLQKIKVGFQYERASYEAETHVAMAINKIGAKIISIETANEKNIFRKAEIARAIEKQLIAEAPTSGIQEFVRGKNLAEKAATKETTEIRKEAANDSMHIQSLDPVANQYIEYLDSLHPADPTSASKATVAIESILNKPAEPSNEELRAFRHFTKRYPNEALEIVDKKCLKMWPSNKGLLAALSVEIIDPSARAYVVDKIYARIASHYPATQIPAINKEVGEIIHATSAEKTAAQNKSSDKVSERVQRSIDALEEAIEKAKLDPNKRGLVDVEREDLANLLRELGDAVKPELLERARSLGVQT